MVRRSHADLVVSEVALLALVLALQGCSESEERTPLDTPDGGATVDATPPRAPADASPHVPEPREDPPPALPGADAGRGSAPDAAVPGFDPLADGGREGPSLEPVDAGAREPDPTAVPDVPCASSSDCAPDEHCFLPRRSACGTLPPGGRCAPRPASCDPASRPVCGCDGHTYPNACGAWLAGTNVREDGPC